MNEALKEFWKAFGISSPPPGVEAALERGGRVVAYHERWDEGLKVTLQGDWPPWNVGTFHLLPDRGNLRKAPSAAVEVHGERLWVEVASNLVLRREGRRKKAYLRAVHEERLKDVLEGARFLRTFLSEAGFSDMEGALLALPSLEDGEIRQEGPYVVARKGENWALFRGVLFGNPALDGVFLMGDTVTLPLREGVEIALRGYFFERRVSLSAMSVRWGEERADYHGRGLGPSYPVLEDHVVPRLLRAALREFAGSDFLTAKVAALAEEIQALRPEEFLKALGSEAFFRRVWLRALSRL
jgi:hypothetical protein